MPYFLNSLYLCAVFLLSPWLLYLSLRTGKYRQGFKAKFLGLAPKRSGDRTCVWLHAVSVGEVNLLAPLIEQLQRRHPDWDLVVSATSRTGFELATKKYAHLTVFYCPLDFSWAVRAAMRRVRPDLLVLAELELWPNLIRAARQSGAKVVIINGRLSERSFRGYRRLRWLVRPLLSRISLIAPQNEVYAERFRQLGAEPDRVSVTGSIKFDGAQTDRRNRRTLELAALAGIAPDDIVVLAGSTQEPEESLAIEAYRTLHEAYPRLRLVIVPRHPERFGAVAALLDQSGLPWQRRSELVAPSQATRILLVDTIGELAAWWGTAQIAFVGGSLDGKRGGQNMIEPAGYGAAVGFGPYTQNFRDIVSALLDRQAAVVVQDGAGLTTFVRRCLEDAAYAAELGRRAQELVLQQRGATLQTVELLEQTLAAERGSTAETADAA